MMLDTKKQMSSRMFFLAEEEESELSQSYILTKGVRMCKQMDVYLIVSWYFIIKISWQLGDSLQPRVYVEAVHWFQWV